MPRCFIPEFNLHADGLVGQQPDEQLPVVHPPRPSECQEAASTSEAFSPQPDHDRYHPRFGPLLTADEVATLLKCHVSTVSDLFHTGKLKGFSLTGNNDKKKRGKKGLRFPASSVEEYVSRAIEDAQAAVVQEVGVSSDPLPARAPSVSACPKFTRPSRAGKSRVLLPYPS